MNQASTHQRGPEDRSQITVSVTIVGVDDHAQVFYSYTDYATGQRHVDSVVADVAGVVPYHTLFALDYASTRNGWLFEPRLTDKDDYPPTSFWTADNAMSLVTGDKDDYAVHRFSLHFRNRYTQAEIMDDPQENNVRQPR